MPSSHTTHLAAVATVVALVAAASASPVLAQPDLRITQMTVLGAPRQGPCNTVAMTVRNDGDQFTETAGIDIFLATHSAGASNQNRAEKTAMISPLQAGKQASFNVSDVELAAQGSMTVQALVDSTEEVAETDENNNTRTLNVTVNGECYAAPPAPPAPPANCDLQATFTEPGGTSLPGGQEAQFIVQFSNPSDAGACAAARLKLMRYSARTCSGYGSQVGGSRAWQSLPALGPGQSAAVSFTEKATPKRGAYCYKLDYSPRGYNTETNSHRPEKVVSYN